MLNTGLAVRIWKQYGESFPHPHNTYLQWIFDNGLFAFMAVILFYLIVMRGSVSLFLDNNDPECRAIGGVTLALVGALLIAGMGSQSFYPREGSMPMWAAMGLALRCYVQRRNWLTAKSPQKVDFARLSSAT